MQQPLFCEAGIAGLETSDDQSQLPYWLALTQVPGLGPRSVAALLAAMSTPEEIWAAPASRLKEVLKARHKEAVIEAWQQLKQALNPIYLLETYQSLGIQILPITHPDYPPLLKQIYDPPVVLFVRGRVAALTGKTLAFVGTRKMTAYGQQVTETVIGDLKPVGPVIVSGLAAGIDGVAHQAALNHQLTTVAVFGCGIDQIFPAHHQGLAKRILEAGGALVSEYGLGVPANKGTFPQRNRIVAGLCYATVVVEGDIGSGALITAKLAMEENRTVFAVPGNIFSPVSRGPNQLIQQGATALTSAEQLLTDLHWSGADRLCVGNPKLLESASQEGLTDDQKSLLKRIDYEPTTVESIQQRCVWPIEKVRQTLTLLEIEGLIRPHPGGKVSRN